MGAKRPAGEGSTAGLLDDLWHFSGGMWRFRGGGMQPGNSGSYGALGVRAAANWPGSRGLRSMWRDTSDVLRLFGGLGYPAGRAGYDSSPGLLSDLWSFVPTASGGTWAWEGGSSGVDSAGNYDPSAGALEVGARRGASVYYDAQESCSATDAAACAGFTFTSATAAPPAAQPGAPLLALPRGAQHAPEARTWSDACRQGAACGIRTYEHLAPSCTQPPGATSAWCRGHRTPSTRGEAQRRMQRARIPTTCGSELPPD